MYTTVRRSLALPFTLLLCGTLLACDTPPDADVAAATEASEPPPLQDLALPVSLRTGDPALSNPFVVEATTETLRLDGKVLLRLDKGKVANADRGGGVLPALQAALQGGTRGGIALRLAANVRYDTVALVMNTAAQAGIHDAAFQVRKTGQNNQTGWLALRGFVPASKADDLPAIPGVEYRSWNEFTDHWQEVFDGCKSGMTANCAYVDDNIASGGTLRMELMTSGRGVNVNFFRRGLSPTQEEEEEKKQAAQLAQKKEDFLQGRITKDDMIEALLLGHPSTYALFQFRYQEALQGPSALGKTIAPLCSGQKCGLVLRGDNHTPFVRVATMIGAAFPDGTPLPSFAIELPWTERPKPADLQAFIERQQAL